MAPSISNATVLLCLVCAGPGWLVAGAVKPHTRCSSDGATCAEGAIQPVTARVAPNDAGAQLSLLQRRSSRRDPEHQAARLEAMRPIAWMHVPKSGTSFINLLIHLPGNCPGYPTDFAITQGLTDNDMFGGSCPGAFAQGEKDWINGHHNGIGEIYDGHKGHWVTTLRQPEQRLVSAYHYGRQFWSNPPYGSESDQPRDMLEYAQVMAGCAVKMLTRPDPACASGREPPPDHHEVALAIERLSGFSFVGLVDEWALSMCLGHQMFGGRCRSSDFMDTRVTPPGDHPTIGSMWKGLQVSYNEINDTHDTSELQGFRDPYDGPLYEAAKKRFKEDCVKYHVSVESCQLCFQDAGVKVIAETPHFLLLKGP